MSYENLITSAKFLGSGIKWETPDPDSPKIGKTCKISLPTALYTLCKPLPMFSVDINSPFHYD